MDIVKFHRGKKLLFSYRTINELIFSQTRDEERNEKKKTT